jgi:hypothetical protein
MKRTFEFNNNKPSKFRAVENKTCEFAGTEPFGGFPIYPDE